MNRSPITSRLALSLSTLMLSLLTACGGGGDGGGSAGTFSGADTFSGPDTPSGADVGPVASAPSAEVQASAVPTVCGVVAAPVIVASGAERVDFVYDQFMNINSVEVPMRLLTSPSGYPYDIGPHGLSLPMEDLRDVMSLGYTPVPTSGSMGVEMGSRTAVGSVACINGVSRIMNNGTEETPNYLLSWTSTMLTNVPVGALPDTAVNGFEYTHNFTDKPASAVFRLSKSQMSDISGVQICHVNRNGAVDCEAPEVTGDEQQWTFRRSISESGIYMLSAPLAPLVALN
jgi:hypothetical protein